MNRKKLVLAVLLVTVIIPAKVSAQYMMVRPNELTGYNITTTAGTLDETEKRLDFYSSVGVGTITDSGLGGALSAIIGNLGASFLYGMSRNVELGVNIQSFDNIIAGNTINIPEIHLNAKVNFMPKYDYTGLGIGFQLLSYRNDEIELVPDIYGIWTTTFQEAVGLTLQMGLQGLSNISFRTALVAAPHESTNVLLEFLYSGGDLWLVPGINLGKEDGFRMSIGTSIEVANIDISNLGISVKGGIKF